MKHRIINKFGLGIILGAALMAGYGGVCSPSSSDNSGSSASVYEATGISDTDFGVLGVVTTTIGTNSDIDATVIQSDGKILVAGSTTNGSDSDFALARYTSAGVLDTTFGTGGVVTTSIGTSYDYCETVAVQTNGKIIVGGMTYNGSSYNDVALIRYNANGAIDTSFGTNGVVTHTLGIETVCKKVIILPNGNILAGGFTNNPAAFLLERYTSGGVLDTTFGNGGVITNSMNPVNLGYCMALQADGKIVQAGVTYNFGPFYLAVVRYTPAGVLDNTFGTGGVVTSTVGIGATPDDEVESCVIQPDGKIVVAGASTNSSSDYYGMVARYTSDGVLDTTFGIGGAITTTIPASTDTEYYGVKLQSNGKILVAGYANPGNSEFMLARYNTNGTLDTTFGTNGIILEPMGTGAAAFDLALQSDGKIVAVGNSTYSGNDKFTLVRYK